MTKIPNKTVYNVKTPYYKQGHTKNRIHYGKPKMITYK